MATTIDELRGHIEAVVNYNWQSELRDAKENGLRGHVMNHLLALADFMGWDTADERKEIALAALDLRNLAQEWAERIQEMVSSVPNTEGMSWGEVAEATERFLAEPEQVEYVAQYVDLCKEYGISPAEPETLERWAEEHELP